MTYPLAIGDRRELYSDLSIANAQSIQMSHKVTKQLHRNGHLIKCILKNL